MHSKFHMEPSVTDLQHNSTLVTQTDNDDDDDDDDLGCDDDDDGGDDDDYSQVVMPATSRMTWSHKSVSIICMSINIRSLLIASLSDEMRSSLSMGA